MEYTLLFYSIWHAGVLLLLLVLVVAVVLELCPRWLACASKVCIWVDPWLLILRDEKLLVLAEAAASAGSLLMHCDQRSSVELV